MTQTIGRMGSWWRRLLAGAVAGAAFAALPAQAVQLKSGEMLLGEIKTPDENGFQLVRFDNGGQLQLRWDQLSPASAERLKQVYSLVAETEAEVLVNADVIEWSLPDGTTGRAVGRVVDEPADVVKIRTRSGVFDIPRQKVLRRTTLQVPALQAMTNEEFYNDQLAQVAPGDDADKHVVLADRLMGVRDYPRAKTHLDRAKELGNSKQPALVDGKLEKLKLFEAAKAERDSIDEIAAARARREFKKGEEKIAEYEKKHGANGRLKAEFEAEKTRFVRERERALTRQVVDLWHAQIQAIAAHKAADEKFEWGAVKPYVESQMGKDIRAKIVEVLKIKLDEVNQLWEKRLAMPGLPAPNYYYGVGSWVLGEGDILKDTAQGKSEAADKKDKSGGEDKQLEAITRKIIEARKRAQAAMGGGGKGEYTPADWWRDAEHYEKVSWLKAYYAERSGDMKMVRAYTQPCLGCGGEGTIPEGGDTGQPTKVKCSTCQGTRHRRIVRAQ
jgi:hypothetical protein